ncbi:hypothetical protein ASNO1_29840 [Corallococcus caeni]|uniref:Uncharacterized protein n=1 Tax=Corallococcus caeni TaxID=3082388 RepID=A0ABQ6QRT1_9BACT|nr:hypothetical protein ASNO1_29840 [Corallococcus sp. NO1]
MPPSTWYADVATPKVKDAGKVSVAELMRAGTVGRRLHDGKRRDARAPDARQRTSMPVARTLETRPEPETRPRTRRAGPPK